MKMRVSSNELFSTLKKTHTHTHTHTRTRNNVPRSRLALTAQTRQQGRSAVGPRWALSLPVGKGADRIAKYKHVQYIYTTQLGEPAFAIP